MFEGFGVQRLYYIGLLGDFEPWGKKEFQGSELGFPAAYEAWCQTFSAAGTRSGCDLRSEAQVLSRLS